MLIKKIGESDIAGLNKLPPQGWDFDYEAFLTRYISDDFFHAFILVQDETIVGTGNVFLKGAIGWLANIIVDENYRGKGLGFKLTTFLVDFLNSKGCKTQLLIATHLGESTYRKVGFKKVSTYQCFDSIEGKQVHHSNSIRALSFSDLESLYELDCTASGESRTHLLVRYYKTGFGYFNAEHKLQGFYLPDFGSGAVIALNHIAGIELLKLKHSQKGQRTFLPIENQVGIDFFEENSFKKGPKYSRMMLGLTHTWNPTYIYSYGSGYCG